MRDRARWQPGFGVPEIATVDSLRGVHESLQALGEGNTRLQGRYSWNLPGAQRAVCQTRQIVIEETFKLRERAYWR
jgi:hypothetical protein